jgi:hypothetical protein
MLGLNYGIIQSKIRLLSMCKSDLVVKFDSIVDVSCIKVVLPQIGNKYR